MQKTHNKFFITILCIVLTCIFAGSITGCQSSRNINRSLYEHQGQLAELEAEAERVRRQVDSAGDKLQGIYTDISEFNSRYSEELTDIRRGSSEMGDDIERIISLFERYDRVVQSMLRDYDQIRARVKEIEEDITDMDNNLNSINSY